LPLRGPRPINGARFDGAWEEAGLLAALETARTSFA
jgi:hypothetical protein